MHNKKHLDSPSTQKTALLQLRTQTATQELYREPATTVNGRQGELDYQARRSFSGKECERAFIQNTRTENTGVGALIRDHCEVHGMKNSDKGRLRIAEEMHTVLHITMRLNIHMNAT